MSFDKKAKDWDDNRRIQRSKVIAEKIIDYVNLQETFSGLEFGCGTGLISLNLYDKLDKITCIDTSSGMIKQLEDKVAEHNLDKITVTQLNINDDHDLKSEYDIIYSSMSLHHVTSLEETLQNFYDFFVVFIQRYGGIYDIEDQICVCCHFFCFGYADFLYDVFCLADSGCVSDL